jgi:hypothetical protein
MIARLWYAWTSPASADDYERFLRDDIFPAMRGRGYRGLHGLDLLRRPEGDEVEFVTVLWFGSIDDVREFAGEEYERAVVADEDRALLSRFSDRVQHYDVSATVRI